MILVNCLIIMKIKTGIQCNKMLAVIALIAFISSCNTAKEINGFGSGNQFFISKNKIKTITHIPLSKSQQRTPNTPSVKHLDTQQISLKNRKSISPENDPVENSTFRTKLNKSKEPSQSTKSKLITKLLNTKLKKQIHKKQSFIPDSDSESGYSLLFTLFCIFFFVGLLTVIIPGDSSSKIMGVLFLITGIIHLLGLLTFYKLEECGTLYEIGFWGSMFGYWLLGIPLLIWILGALTCDF